MNEPSHIALTRIEKRYRDRDPSRLVDFLRTNSEGEQVMGELVEAILTEIEKSELTRYELARRAGLQESQLSRFVHRERSVSLETLEKLLGALELKIKFTPSRKRPTGRTPKPRG
ncbi:MAG: helix-turn-helix transcriptional regulator [Thermoanaerobaculia bacterium]|jgi:DNA-binding phage protein